MQGEVNIRNLELLTRFPENLVAVTNAAFRRLVDDTVARAKENVSGGPSAHSMGRVISRTGKLRESIKKGPYKQWSPGSYGEQRVYTNLIYARVHEFGATIRPRARPYLVFRLWEPTDTIAPTGPWVRARQVTIPPRPYLGPAAEASVKNWPELVREAMAYIGRNL